MKRGLLWGAMFAVIAGLTTGCGDFPVPDQTAPQELPPTEVLLTGNVYPDRVELMWLINGWPEDTDGFLVKRRERDAAEWQQLSPVPIYPELNRNKNWAVLGLNAEQTNACLSQWDTKTSAAKRNSRMTHEDLMEMLSTSGVNAGDRLAMRENYLNALLFGFGYIDNAPLPDGEYALFGVDDDGRESTEPLAVFDGKPIDEAQYKVRDLKADVRYSTVVVCFSFPGEEYRRLQLTGFRIYRRLRPDADWETIQYQLEPSDPKGDTLHLEVIGTNNASRPVDFAVSTLGPFELEIGRVELHWPGTPTAVR